MGTKLVAVAAVTLAMGAACDDAPDRPPERSRIADCTTGPWADHCAEARWAREVAAAAGFDVTGDTGSALTIERGPSRLHLWAFTPEEPELRTQQLEEEAYEEGTTVRGVLVFGDGLRVTWETYGLYVWLAEASHARLDATASAVRRIVRASTTVPWP